VTRLSPGPGTADVAIDPEDPQETTRFLLYTYDRPGQRVVAALDADYLAAEQHALVIALLAAGLGGVVAATAVGWLIGNRAVRPLGHALALQRRFVADASHELRTPLTIVHTRAQVIARRAQVDDRTRADLERLVTDTRVLGDIVNDLLLSAELQHRPEAHELIDLCRLAGDVAESFAPAAEAAGVTLRSEAPHPAVIVAGVPVAIRRAVNALVDNALAHTPTTGTVTVRVSRRDGAAEIAVIDNGEGIHAADAQRLVQRFARAPDAPGRGRRFGLGLALVSEVVEAHGGTLKLSGRPGEGATATITLAAVGDPRR
jgi:signal transduction histidine kinase